MRMQQQRLKQDIVTETEQAFSVMLNVVEFGVASICQKRGLFPSSFFHQRSIRAKGRNLITTFNTDALLSLHESTSLSSQCDNEIHISSSQMTTPTSMSISQPTDITSPLTSSLSLSLTQESSKGSQNINSEEKFLELDRLRAEALLLRHWIQDGVGLSMKKGMLSKVIFNIFMPDKKNISDKNSTRNDRLLESYAFQISVEKANGRPLSRDGLILKTERFFQNLDGFSSTLSPILSSSKASEQRNGKDLDHSIDQFQLTCELSEELRVDDYIPSSRYLSLKFEFSEEFFPQFLIGNPTLVDPFLSDFDEKSNRSDSEAVSVKDLSSSDMLHMPLGKIEEKNVSGLGIHVTALYRDENSELTRNGESWVPKDGKHILDRNSRFDEQSENDTKREQQKRSQEQYTGVTKAMAIPFGLKSSTTYLPCTVIGHRLDKKRKIQYKVSFSNNTLIQMRMKKQWISANKVNLNITSSNINEMHESTSPIKSTHLTHDEALHTPERLTSKKKRKFTISMPNKVSVK